jgi:hypothetical protein
LKKKGAKIFEFHKKFKLFANSEVPKKLENLVLANSAKINCWNKSIQETPLSDQTLSSSYTKKTLGVYLHAINDYYSQQRFKMRYQRVLGKCHPLKNSKPKNG